MSGTRAISTTSRRELSSSFFFFLQGKVPKEIHSILTETVCFLPGRAKDLSAPLYYLSRFTSGTLHKKKINIKSVAPANTDLLAENSHFIFWTSTFLNSCLKPLIISYLNQYTYYCYKREREGGEVWNLSNKMVFFHPHEINRLTFWFDWSHPVVYCFYIFILLIYISINTTI